MTVCSKIKLKQNVLKIVRSKIKLTKMDFGVVHGVVYTTHLSLQYGRLSALARRNGEPG